MPYIIYLYTQTHTKMLSLATQTYLLILLSLVFNSSAITPAQRLSAITKQIKQITTHHHLPVYSVSKLSYTNLTKTSSKNIIQCINRFYESDSQSVNRDSQYEVIPSINIYQVDNVGWPVILSICQQYYTVNGYKIAQFWNPNPPSLNITNKKYSHFISSARNQFTYFAQIEWSNSQSSSIAIIKKLLTRNKKISLQEESLKLQIPTKYGQITDFAFSFSISLKMFAFVTNLGNILFYKQNGILESHINLYQQADSEYLRQQYQPIRIQIVKLNNHLAIFTSQLNLQLQGNFLYTINTNGKNNTLRKYMLSKINTYSSTNIHQSFHKNQASHKFKMQLKYNDKNWNQFYVKIKNRVYVYQQSNSIDKTNEMRPKSWYQLIHQNDRFLITGNMLIVQSDVVDKNQSFRFYYNLTSGVANNLALPYFPCQDRTYLSSSSSQTQNAHIICLFCRLSYECYTIYANSYVSLSSINEYTDYSKLRVPLIIVSIGIIIYVSVTRGKKNKTVNQQKQQQQQQTFMKQLQQRDRKLYEELKMSRRVQHKNKINRQAHNGNLYHED